LHLLHGCKPIAVEGGKREKERDAHETGQRQEGQAKIAREMKKDREANKLLP
jgi:hypothetical protein